MPEPAARNCYWKHAPPRGQGFLCFDGKSRVCARCCVERCRVQYPAWFAECAAAGHPTWPSRLKGLRRSPPRLVALESYWNRRLFLPLTVKDFLAAFATHGRPGLALAHRFVESERGLDYYVRKPDGVLCGDGRAQGATVFYLAFHGAPGEMYSVLDTIGRDTLCRAFEGYGDPPALVYFAACSVLRGARGRRFAQEFLEASGARAVIGYTTRVPWMESMLTDLFFLQRFYAAADPWAELPKVAATVLREHAPARRLGWTYIGAQGRR